MASNTGPSSTFSEDDMRHFRLMKITSDLIQPIFTILLRWVNPQWLSTTETFTSYAVRINHIAKEEDIFKQMARGHKETIQKNPYGDNWNVSLLYSVIKGVNSSLADKESSAWVMESDRLEYLITKVKNDRNAIAHLTKVDEPTFKDMWESIHTNLENLLFRVRHVCPHVTQIEIDDKIAEVRLFFNSPIDGSVSDPVKYEDHMKKIEKHEQFVKTKGRGDLIEGHKSRNRKLCIEDTFEEMVLKTLVNGIEKPLEVKDLLDTSDSLYYFEGNAGTGKTSLIEHLSMDWANGGGKVKGLEEYDLFLHIAGRDHISSFHQFLKLSMPTVLKESLMSIDTLESIIFSLRSIIVFDGYDEKNSMSAKLLQEVMSLKKDFKFTLLVTGRPEATRQFCDLAKSFTISVKHIKVLGINKTQREELLKKYAHVMGCRHDIQPLIEFLKKTDHRLSEVWALPNNLISLVIIWANNPSVINSITSSGLHWLMHKVTISKLKERLLNFHYTKHLDSYVIDRKVEDFLCVLYRISLTALAKNDVVLTAESYEQLLNRCIHLEIPMEEMVGAFLKPYLSITGDTYYTFPHKGVRDFLAALYIFNRLSFTSQHALEDIKIKKILEATCGDISVDDFSKFHNMLLSLLQILHMKEDESGSVQNKEKQEVLELLQDTGVKEKDHWLRLLKNVKRDEFVATFISQQTDVLKEYIQIDDDNLFAYNCIFQATTSFLTDDALKADIKVKGSIADAEDILSQINRLKLQVGVLEMTEENIVEYTYALRNLSFNFKNPEEVNVRITLERDIKPLAKLREELKKNGLHVSKLRLEFDFTFSSAAAKKFDDNDGITKLAEKVSKLNEIERDLEKKVAHQ